jgi:hypothetical protein
LNSGPAASGVVCRSMAESKRIPSSHSD